jgi:hypothetical protein
MTRTIAILRVTPETYREIHDKLDRAGGYEHAFRTCDGRPTLDLDGLAIQADLDSPKEFSPHPGFEPARWRERLRKLAKLPRDDCRGAFCSPAMLDDVQAAIAHLDALEGRTS